ncbi:MAG: WecB/TagA/CpsF family glycosyltransferase [Akkermansia sp.]
MMVSPFALLRFDMHPETIDRPAPLDYGTIFGLPVVVSNPQELVDFLTEKAIQPQQRAFLVAAADVHVMTLGCQNEAYGEILRQIDLICPDGMPLVYLLNRQQGEGARRAERCSGPDVMKLCMDAKGMRHFLLGGSEKTLALLESQLRSEHPECVMAGAYSPPFAAWSDDEQAKMVKLIRESGANVVWVGFGCPKQETWMVKHQSSLPPAIYLGVGAAFDFHSGTVKRAPLWMQKMSLEWAYRIMKEPRRLLGRYLRFNSLFLWYLATKKQIKKGSGANL